MIIPSEAEGISDFVKRMLVYQPENRITARECLRHKWLYEPPIENYYLSETEHARYVREEEAKEVSKTAYIK